MGWFDSDHDRGFKDGKRDQKESPVFAEVSDFFNGISPAAPLAPGYAEGYKEGREVAEREKE